MRSLPILAVVAILAVSRSAHAQDAASSDPAGPTGLVLSGVSVAAIAGGTALRVHGAAGGGEEICGLTGCITRPSHDRRIAGAGLLGAGIGMGLVAAPTAFVGYLGEPRERPRHSDAMTVAGITTTSAGLAFLGGAIGTLVEQDARAIGSSEAKTGFAGPREVRIDRERPDVGAWAALHAALGVGCLAVGIPLWGVGNADAEPLAAAPEQRVRPDGSVQEVPMTTVDNSPGMRGAGIGLTLGGATLAGVGTAVGIAITAGEPADGDFRGLHGLLVGGAIGGAGALMVLTGIPLWIAGEWDVVVPADDPRALEASEDAWVRSIELQVSPTGLELMGSF